MSYVPYVTLKFTLPQVTVLAGPKERGIVLYCKAIKTCAVETKYSYVTGPTTSILLHYTSEFTAWNQDEPEWKSAKLESLGSQTENSISADELKKMFQIV